MFEQKLKELNGKIALAANALGRKFAEDPGELRQLGILTLWKLCQRDLTGIKDFNGWFFKSFYHAAKKKVLNRKQVEPLTEYSAVYCNKKYLELDVVIRARFPKYTKMFDMMAGGLTGNHLSKACGLTRAGILSRVKKVRGYCK